MVGTMSGTSMSTRTASVARVLTRQQPIAASVPTVTASAVAATAMTRLCPIEESHASLVKSFT